MLSTFFSSLCFIALYGNALKQPGNATHLSFACCSPRHLGVSLRGESFCCKPIEETQNVANLSLARVPQRDMVCFCCLALCEKALNQAGNATHLSHARCSLRHLGVSLCGESICWKPMEETMWTQRIKFPCTFTKDLVSLLVVILVLLRVGPRVGLNNKRQLKFRKACSCN